MVVLDAAHGGGDSGARLDGGQLEKTFTLALSIRLRSLLGARGIQVTTTREQDIDVDPVKRAEIANRAQAQACVSLHGTESGTGVHIYVSSLPPVQPAVLSAWKTAQSAWVQRSVALAGVLNSTLTRAGMNVTVGRIALPAIDSMACPAVAVEIAPQPGENGKSGAGLDDPGLQARISEALATALLEWRSEAHQP
jgi:N-acetylmuramoyl-L-alanine amidase